MENSTFIFPTTQLITANPLIFPSLNPLINHSTCNPLSQKRFLDTSYSPISEDFEPVKKHFKSEMNLNSLRATKEEPILIDDESEDLISKSISFDQKNNYENLLQLSLFSAYLDQVEQAREVKRRYSVLFANFAQSLFNQGNRDSDLSTNDSEIDSMSPISNQQSPIDTRARKLSAYIELDSDIEEDIVVHKKKPVVGNKTVEKKANGQFTISSDLLADLPNLERKSMTKSTGNRVLKMVWSPEEQKIQDIQKLTNELEEGLGVKISNQERVCKLYSENNFSLKDTVKNVLDKRSKYRFELKDKRAVVSLKNKSMKL